MRFANTPCGGVVTSLLKNHSWFVNKTERKRKEEIEIESEREIKIERMMCTMEPKSKDINKKNQIDTLYQWMHPNETRQYYPQWINNDIDCMFGLHCHPGPCLTSSLITRHSHQCLFENGVFSFETLSTPSYIQ